MSAFLASTFLSLRKLAVPKYKPGGRRKIGFLMQFCVLPDDARVSNFQSDIVLKIEEVAALDNGVRQVEADADVTVRKNRAVFYHGSEIHSAITFNVAATGNQALLCDLCATANEGWRNNSSILVDLGLMADPHAVTESLFLAAAGRNGK